MFSWKEFEKTKTILIHSAGENYRDDWGQHHIRSRPNELLDWVEFLKEDLGFFTLVDIAGVDLRGGRYEINYLLLNMGSHQRLNLHLFLSEKEVVPTLVPFFCNADWMEREQEEMLGLSFSTVGNGLLLPKGQKVFPLRKAQRSLDWPQEPELEIPSLRYNPNKSETPYPEESYVWKHFNLLSPQTLGLFDWLVCFDSQKVVETQVRIGYHHQSIEKILETKDLIQILHLVDRINPESSVQYSIAWAKTIEDMFRIRIPERAQALRLILLELTRITDHLTVLSSICLEAKQDEAKYFINAREKIYELLERFSGQRLGQGLTRIGGVSQDLPFGWIVEYQLVSEILSKNLPVVHRALINQKTFRSHLESDALDAQSILRWGVSGPAMRAAGLNYDLRKSQPFYFYQDIDFDIPVGINGSVYDRYLIRYEEIFQSLRIITQVIDNLPLGEIVPEQFNRPYPEVLHSFRSLEFPTQWHYSAIESSSGEAGFLVQLDEEFMPNRIKVKTPGFTIAQAISVFSKGLRENQLSTGLSSLGLNRWEMDR
jgi:NADH-quinone oxidoreductase subunit C/D